MLLKKNFISMRITWIFLFILTLSNSVSTIDFNVKKFSNLKYLQNLFNLFNFDIIQFVNNWKHSNFYKALLHFLYILPINFNKKVYYSFFNNFKKFLNTLNVLFVPNFVFRKVDITISITKSYNFKNYLSVTNNVFFVYYKELGFHKSYISFLFFIKVLNLNFLSHYSYLLVTYISIFQNIFYKDFSQLFLLKNKNSLGTLWSENRRKFIINFYSIFEKNDNSYVQKILFTSYSSLKFCKLLNFTKKMSLAFSLKLVMIQHFRRMLICTDISRFLVFLKNYIKDFKLLFLQLSTPTNEIFIHPDVDTSDKIVCDISLSLDNFKSIDTHMSKYKTCVQNFFSDDFTFIKKWDLFLKDFVDSLFFIKNPLINSTLNNFFVRYYFDCNILFILKKKILPLKKKKAQSIKRRRYKQIVKSAKRRFWIF